MSPTPYIHDLLTIAIRLAESLSDRIPRSSSLQRDCKQLVTNLRNCRKRLPVDVESLLRPTGDKDLYKAILSPLSELLCMLCQLTWTAHEFSKPFSLATISRTTDAEQKIASASPTIKKSQTDLGVWQKPRKGGHAPLAVLFDPATRRNDARFTSAEGTVRGFVVACCGALAEAEKKVHRAVGRHLGLRLLSGKAG